MIETEGIEVIFSHLHSVDFVEHTFIRYMHTGRTIGFFIFNHIINDIVDHLSYRQCCHRHSLFFALIHLYGIINTVFIFNNQA